MLLCAVKVSALVRMLREDQCWTSSEMTASVQYQWGWESLNMFHLWCFKAVRVEWFSVTLLCSGSKLVSTEKYISRLKKESMHCLVFVPIIYSMTIKRLWQFSNKTKCLYFVIYKTFRWLLYLLFQWVILYGSEWSTKLTFI